MNRKDLLFLFAIAKELKRSFDNPVILLTMKDYAEDIFNSLVDLRALLHQNATPERVEEIVNTFHINWLQALQDVENFKKRVKDTPREVIQRSIEFTMECLNKRHKYFLKYIEQFLKKYPDTETALLQADVEVIEDMQDTVNFSLMEKQKCLKFASDKTDYHLIILNEIEELLNWLDRLNDNLAIQFVKILELSDSGLLNNLKKTLQHVIDLVARSSTPEALTVVDEMCRRSRTIGYLGRVKTSINNLEINKVVEKIKQVEERIARLKAKSSSKGIMALEHKTIFLEERLESLEHLKVSLNFLRTQSQESDAQESGDKNTNKENEIRIFNHLLPHQQRCYLVEKLIELWKTALIQQNGKSFVSILPVADLREVFSDELGHFTIDKHGRKLYRTEEDDDVYQLNERNELVSVKDDEKHVYFYDECGRYYLTDNKERIYKTCAAASEYLLHRSGFMLKVGEVLDDVEYKYDNLGRYYIDDNGGHIYRDKDSSEEYRPDGFGNLVMIRDEEPRYEPCPVEMSFTEESKYLKEAVGAALKKCLAEVVLVQPTDPVKFLAAGLEEYRNNMEARQKRLEEERLMMVERENLPNNTSNIEHMKPPHSSRGEAESDVDYNFLHYVTNGSYGAFKQ